MGLAILNGWMKRRKNETWSLLGCNPPQKAIYCKEPCLVYRINYSGKETAFFSGSLIVWVLKLLYFNTWPRGKASPYPPQTFVSCAYNFKIFHQKATIRKQFSLDETETPLSYTFILSREVWFLEYDPADAPTILKEATAWLDSDLNRTAINSVNGELLDIQ